MIRYYCSGFDLNNAFGNGLGEMFKEELLDTQSIVYIPTSQDRVEKAITKHIPIFTEHFKKVGIEFAQVNVISEDLSPEEAKNMIKNAGFVMLLGGDPFDQKKLCEKLGIIDELRNYEGVMLGLSAGAMLMSKYIIITPCSEEYPDFHIEEGLNLDNISIYPHNNTPEDEYPEILVNGEETYKRDDLIEVSKKYGEFYLLQDYVREDGLSDISYIKSVNGNLEFYTENNGKIWTVDKDIKLLSMKKIRKEK